MNDKYSKNEIEKTIDGILNILEANFLGNVTSKLNKKNVLDFTKDLYKLFNAYTNLDFKICSQVIKKRYIPLLSMLIKLDYVGNDIAQLYTFLENAYMLSARYDFESFVIYYEWEEEDKFYEPRYEILGAYAFYLDKMAN